MSNHITTLVPIETWCYSSPELRSSGKSIDVGLFAEALIYYDQVLLNLTNQPQFAEFLTWLVNNDGFEDFLSLVNDGTIRIYEYSFATAAMLIQKTGSRALYNLQDEIQAKPDTFRQRFLDHEAVRSALKGRKQHRSLVRSLRGRVIEVKAEEFGNPNDNAGQDFLDANRQSLILQAFVDELYDFRELGKPPKIEVNIALGDVEGQKSITWNIDFEDLEREAGTDLNFHLGTPLTAGALSNRLIWSASSMKCDLYLGQPMGMLVGDKLCESNERLTNPQAIIDTLQTSVEFPDIRRLVNTGKIDFKEILRIRSKAGKLRSWLQDESERDRDALVAYHNEVAIESGYIRVGRKTLRLFGALAGGAVGGALGSAALGPPGAAVGGAVGGGLGFLMEVASRLGSNWKPVVFGNWYKSRIEEILRKNR